MAATTEKAAKPKEEAAPVDEKPAAPTEEAAKPKEEVAPEGEKQSRADQKEAARPRRQRCRTRREDLNFAIARKIKEDVKLAIARSLW